MTKVFNFQGQQQQAAPVAEKKHGIAPQETFLRINGAVSKKNGEVFFVVEDVTTYFVSAKYLEKVAETTTAKATAKRLVR